MTRVTQMGLTVAIPARDMPQEREAARAYLQDLSEQMQAALKVAAGGVEPCGPLAVNLAGPEDNALLGPIFGFTIAAPIDADLLPPDCEFYAAYNGGAGGVIEAERGDMVTGGDL